MSKEEVKKDSFIEKLTKLGPLVGGFVAFGFVVFQCIGFLHLWGYLSAYQQSPLALGVDTLGLLFEASGVTLVSLIHFFNNFFSYVVSALWYLLLIVVYVFAIFWGTVGLRISFERFKKKNDISDDHPAITLSGVLIGGALKGLYYICGFMLTLSLPTYVAIKVFQDGHAAAVKEITEFKNCSETGAKCIYVMDKDGKTEIAKGFPIMTTKDLVALYDGKQSVIYRLSDEQLKRTVPKP
ncbi:hypothetical protein WH50_24680 [Pokkaliibacter plantistimulans]|uniref:Uncharacterized protein n=1 Tax=Pokkaliibacter plantistimulans TaxID=1635171 RepID=A0ABX5LPZ9_9GAMM|nr:hypothetical protein [Pokkaliibacter plantistimulans]PXF28735.1 hypothetical protein WH50_24680 [Pokkaliibacter plantistimulans]